MGSQNGIVTIPSAAVTDNVVITAAGVPVYTVTYNYEGVSGKSGPARIEQNTQLTAEFTLQSGYMTPTAVTVKVNGTALTEGMEYDSASGKITVDASKITADVVVIVTAVKPTLTYALENGLLAGTTMTGDTLVTIKEGKYTINAQATVTATITAQDNYKLPESVKVTITPMDATQQSYTVGGENNTGGLTYDRSNGTITIAANLVNGNVVIEARGVDIYVVTYPSDGVKPGKVDDEDSPDRVPADENAILDIDPADEDNDGDPDYALPDEITVTIGAKEYPVDKDPDTGVDPSDGGITYDPETGKIVIPEEIIDGNIVISAEGIPLYDVYYDFGTNDAADANDHMVAKAQDAAHDTHILAGTKQNVARVLKADAGYWLKAENITVTMNGVELTAGDETYSVVAKDTATVELTIHKAFDGDVRIEAKAVEFTVTYPEDDDTGIAKGTVDGSDSPTAVTNDQDVILDINPVEDDDEDDIPDYVLPDQITVTIGDKDPVVIGDENTSDDQGITYDPETGEIKIPKDQITGDIRIDGTATPLYTVKYELTEASQGTNDPLVIVEKSELKATLKANAGYLLPHELTSITVGGTILTAGTDYTYTYETGEIAIPAAKIIGDVVITAVAAKPTFTYELTHLTGNKPQEGAAFVSGSATQYTVNANEAVSAVITADIGYALPESVTVTIKDPASAAATEYVLTNGAAATANGLTYVITKDSATGAESLGTVTIPGEAVIGDIQVLAKAWYPVAYPDPDTDKVDQGKIDEDTLSPDKVPGNTGDGEGGSQTIVIEPEPGTVLPDEIIVTIGNKEYPVDKTPDEGESPADGGITYDPETGEIVIPEEIIDGAIDVEADGKYTLRYILGENSLLKGYNPVWNGRTTTRLTAHAPATWWQRLRPMVMACSCLSRSL